MYSLMSFSFDALGLGLHPQDVWASPSRTFQSFIYVSIPPLPACDATLQGARLSLRHVQPAQAPKEDGPEAAGAEAAQEESGRAQTRSHTARSKTARPKT